MEVNTDVLRKQVMVSQFVNAVGCSPDEATQILTSARWQFEVRIATWVGGRHAGHRESLDKGHWVNAAGVASSLINLWSP